VGVGELKAPTSLVNPKLLGFAQGDESVINPDAPLFDFATETIRNNIYLYPVWIDKNVGTEGLIYTYDEETTGYLVSGFAPQNRGINKEIVIPAQYSGVNVTGITDTAFVSGHTYDIQSIEFSGAAIIQINAGALKNISTLKEIIVPAACSNYKTLNGVLYKTQGGSNFSLLVYPAAKDGTGYNMNGLSLNGGTYSIVKIESYAFANAKNLTTVTLQTGVPVEIAPYAFSGAINLTTVTLTADVTKIGDYAFERCLKLNGFGGFETGSPAFTSDTFEMTYLAVEDTKWYVDEQKNSETEIIFGTYLIRYVGLLSQTYVASNAITVIMPYAFRGEMGITSTLKKVEFGVSSNLIQIRALAFEDSNIDVIIIRKATSILPHFSDNAFGGGGVNAARKLQVYNTLISDYITALPNTFLPENITQVEA
jgi:hypothetical protein